MFRKSIIISLSSYKLSLDEIRLLKNYKPWGVILFKRNIKSLTQIRDLTSHIKDIMNDRFYPIMVDEEGGIFATSVDAFFATKSSTIPVRAEIRTMVNGYPSQELLPFSQKYLNPGSVNTSTDGATATTFTFDSPVFLQEGLEYCLILYYIASIFLFNRW